MARLEGEHNEEAKIKYRLIGSHPAFMMNESYTGDIYTRTVLDRETEEYFLYTVEAVDNQAPPRTGYVTVGDRLQPLHC